MILNDIFWQIDRLKNSKNIDFVSSHFSTLNLPIDLFHIGKYNSKQILIEAGIHAREYISTLFAINQILYLSEKNLDFGIYFVLLANPDGVGLVLENDDFLSLNKKRKKEVLKINNSSHDFSLWKANIRGVDCNVNFDALWGNGKSNVLSKASANFIGEKPNSEREVKNLIKILNQTKPELTLSYHTKGEVIYYGFEVLNQAELKRDKFIAKQISKYNKYKPVKTKQSTGGFSDYVSEYKRVPAFTIEFGKDTLTHPISKKHLAEIFEKNKDLPIVCFEALKKWERKHNI